MKSSSSNRRAFTLLEIILALAILAGSLAVLGELMRSAQRNGSAATHLTRGQQLAANKLAEITTGITSPQPVHDLPFLNDPDWTYSIDIEPLSESELMAVRVTVVHQASAEPRPTTFTLVRWMAAAGTNAAQLE